MLVQQVAKNSPAARLGLRAGQIPVDLAGSNVILGGDIVLMVNDIRIESPDSIARIRDSLRSYEPGDPMVIEILRAGNRERLELASASKSVGELPAHLRVRD